MEVCAGGEQKIQHRPAESDMGATISRASFPWVPAGTSRH